MISILQIRSLAWSTRGSGHGSIRPRTPKQRALDEQRSNARYAKTWLCFCVDRQRRSSARAALAAATLLRVMRLRAFLLVVGAAWPLRVATGRAADVAGARGPAVHVVGRAHAAVAALALKLLFLGAFLLRGALRLAGLSVGDWSRADGER